MKSFAIQSELTVLASLSFLWLCIMTLMQLNNASAEMMVLHVSAIWYF